MTPDAEDKVSAAAYLTRNIPKRLDDMASAEVKRRAEWLVTFGVESPYMTAAAGVVADLLIAGMTR